jgi:hypothetical protein
LTVSRQKGNIAAFYGKNSLQKMVLHMPKSPTKGPPTHHVVPDSDGGWNVRRGGADRASSHHETKAEAVKAGREVSQNQGTELRIHNLNGQIASSDSHGKDPNPPKG